MSGQVERYSQTPDSHSHHFPWKKPVSQRRHSKPFHQHPPIVTTTGGVSRSPDEPALFTWETFSFSLPPLLLRKHIQPRPTIATLRAVAVRMPCLPIAAEDLKDTFSPSGIRRQDYGDVVHTRSDALHERRAKYRQTSRRATVGDDRPQQGRRQ